jgi:cytochrome c biogenesis protein CcmG/thiol:disulfide interchange protein DsbE
VLFLGLNMQDLSGDAREFLDEFSITYPTIREPSNEVARGYGATGIPETYFISARGRVVSHVVGVISPEQMEAGIRAAVSDRTAGTEEGGDIRPQR